MGNLGRAGYGATVEGLVGIRLWSQSSSDVVFKWPYTYDSCDVGTLPNQTYPGQNRPLAAVTDGDAGYGGVLVSRRWLDRFWLLKLIL